MYLKPGKRTSDTLNQPDRLCFLVRTKRRSPLSHPPTAHRYVYQCKSSVNQILFGTEDAKVFPESAEKKSKPPNLGNEDKQRAETSHERLTQLLLITPKKFTGLMHHYLPYSRLGMITGPYLTFAPSVSFCTRKSTAMLILPVGWPPEMTSGS